MDEFWKQLRELNVERCEQKFHSCASWSLNAWAIACFGELGEACNEIKKLVRGDGNTRRLAAELGDAAIYADLLAHRAGFVLASCEPLSIAQLNAWHSQADAGLTSDCEMVGGRLIRAARKLDLRGGRFAHASAIEAVSEVLPALWYGFALAGVPATNAIREKFNETSGRVGYQRLMQAAA